MKIDDVVLLFALSTNFLQVGQPFSIKITLNGLFRLGKIDRRKRAAQAEVAFLEVDKSVLSSPRFYCILSIIGRTVFKVAFAPKVNAINLVYAI